jgi:hypothetical protein
MNNRRCSDCDFAQPWGEVFLCRFNPPVQIRDVRNDIIDRWPPVAPDDWCGRFEKRFPGSAQPHVPSIADPQPETALAPIHEDFA